MPATTSAASASCARSKAFMPGWCSTNATISTASSTRCASATSPASASMRSCFQDSSCLLKSKLLEQILLQLKHGLGVREGLARDQKHVFRAIAEGVDPGRLQIDLIAGESARDRIEQARPVARHDRQHVVRAALVRADVDHRRDGEMAYAAP